ncbi:hypothetical protein KC360_g219 [Hortaea werneckii]|nr:hypothetical protein KC344_g223 [Hortaea werneckii]KAI7180425.1 hypothetical protein KC360_g219 [Hortaea werneckii]
MCVCLGLWCPVRCVDAESVRMGLVAGDQTVEMLDDFEDDVASLLLAQNVILPLLILSQAFSLGEVEADRSSASPIVEWRRLDDDDSPSGAYGSYSSAIMTSAFGTFGPRLETEPWPSRSVRCSSMMSRLDFCLLRGWPSLPGDEAALC